MRKLSIRQRARAAECLGMAFSHLRVAQKLQAAQEYPASAASLYYAAYFASQAACLELCGHSKRHTFWVGQVNKHFGRGQGWLPRRYAKLVSILSVAREAADYSGTFPNDADLVEQWEYRTNLFLKKVRQNTPVVLYPEFIADFVRKNYFEIDAIEFDYYCPKSYIHKERVQFQIMIEKFSGPYLKRLASSGRHVINNLYATREEDYVLGWNSRLGQSADGYLLFLDLDDDDEGKVKSALRNRRGWLFKTGNGFHFVGRDILPTHKLWRRRLLQAGASAALGTLIDKRHVDFSIRRGYSTLRIGVSENKEFMPFMCWDNSK